MQVATIIRKKQIVCSVCGAENSGLSLICDSCKSFLQSKVDTLDFFSTLRALIEAPQSTFRQIARATHKNYVLLLGSLFGVAWIFALFWLTGVTDRTSELLFFLLLRGAVVGPFLGVAGILLMSTLALVVGRSLGGGATFRNTFAVLSYSTAPIVMSLCFAFPVKIAVFGRDFFGMNPPPMVVHPSIYKLLIGFDILTLLWSILLLIEGISVSNEISRVRGFVIVLAVLVGFAGLSLLVLSA